MSQNTQLKEILNKGLISTLFQPIVDMNNGATWGHEALSRGPSNSPLHSPMDLFDAAEQEGCLKGLEAVCVKSAATSFKKYDLKGKLFVNISHEVMIAGSQIKDKIANLMLSKFIEPSSVVIELTERNSIENTRDLIAAVSEFKSLGFEIAIDDLGTGYSTLQLWSELKPDYVKIDRHFISGIDTDNTKQEFVRSICAIAQTAATKVIAEGVETKGELEVLKSMGLSLFQGFLFARPKTTSSMIDFTQFQEKRVMPSNNKYNAGHLISSDLSVDIDAPVHDVVRQFQDNVCLNSLAILQGQKPVGMIHRKRFLTQMSKQYAMDLATNKSIQDYMDRDFLQIDGNFRLEQVSRLVTNRARVHAEEDFIICQKGMFSGIGQVIDLLRQITEIQVKSARHANPLTMLPGNVPIGDCVNQHLQDETGFVISYFDLDNFKPFNDRYGYAKGDEVLILLADFLKQYLHKDGDFVGHIGGDDFIAVSKAASWMEATFSVLEAFSRSVPSFYDDDAIELGGIEALDRFGKQRFFDFIGVSVGALKVSPGQYHSFQDISRDLAKVKQLAKNANSMSLVYSDENGARTYSNKNGICHDSHPEAAQFKSPVLASSC